tara:strand:+ start:147 stop:473 length:327 start_codon:yes stop_codon:yes gene_type:complete
MIEKLKDILHKEKLKEISEERVEVIPSWEKKYDELAQSLGYEDMMHKPYHIRNPRNITDRKETKALELEDKMNAFRLGHLQRVKSMLLIGGILYPFAILLLLYLIYIS